MELWQWIVAIPLTVVGLWAGFVLMTGGDLPMADRYLGVLLSKLRKARGGSDG